MKEKKNWDRWVESYQTGQRTVIINTGERAFRALETANAKVLEEDVRKKLQMRSEGQAGARVDQVGFGGKSKEFESY